jgi:hypothetical protein
MSSVVNTGVYTTTGSVNPNLGIGGVGVAGLSSLTTTGDRESVINPGPVMKTLAEVSDFVTNRFFAESLVTHRGFGPLTKASLESELLLALKFSAKINQVGRLFNNIVEKQVEKDFSLMPLLGFNYNLPEHILIIGCGGIGSWFLPKFIKLLNDGKRKGLLNQIKTLTICDGDHVEESNLIRQNFSTRDINKGKAETLFKRYVGELNDSISFSYIDKYMLLKSSIDKKKEDIRSRFLSIQDYITSLSADPRGKTNTLIINLIDNNESRKDIHSIVYHSSGSLTNHNIAIIDVANSAYNGQLNFSLPKAIMHDTYDGTSNFTDGRLNYFNMIPENIFLNDKISIFDCSTRDANAVEQLFDINSLAATVLCSYINTIIEKKKIYYKQVSFNSGTNLSIKPDLRLFDVGFDTHNVFFSGTLSRFNGIANERNYLFKSGGNEISSLTQLSKSFNDSAGKAGNHRRFIRGILNCLVAPLDQYGAVYNEFLHNFVDFSVKETDPYTKFFANDITPEIGEAIYKNSYELAFNYKNETTAANQSILRELIAA